jgi:hypothetical protein
MAMDSCFWEDLLSPARGAWECFSPHLIGLAMPIGREKVATVVLALDIIFSIFKDEWELGIFWKCEVLLKRWCR